jgi:hypothetical protein
MESQFVGFVTHCQWGSREQNRGGDDHGNDDDGTAVAVPSVVYGGLLGGAQHIL